MRGGAAASAFWPCHAGTELGSRVDVELAVRASELCLHGLRADVEHRGHGGVREAGGSESRYPRRRASRPGRQAVDRSPHGQTADSRIARDARTTAPPCWTWASHRRVTFRLTLADLRLRRELRSARTVASVAGATIPWWPPRAHPVVLRLDRRDGLPRARRGGARPSDRQPHRGAEDPLGPGRGARHEVEAAVQRGGRRAEPPARWAPAAAFGRRGHAAGALRVTGGVRGAPRGGRRAAAPVGLPRRGGRQGSRVAPAATHSEAQQRADALHAELARREVSSRRPALLPRRAVAAQLLPRCPSRHRSRRVAHAVAAPANPVVTESSA